MIFLIEKMEARLAYIFALSDRTIIGRFRRMETCSGEATLSQWLCLNYEKESTLKEKICSYEFAPNGSEFFPMK